MGAGGLPTRVWVGRQHSGRHWLTVSGCGSPGARRLGRRLGTALLLAGLVVVFLGAVRQRMPYNPTTVLGRLGGAPAAPAAEEPASPGLLSSLATAYEEARHKIGMCTKQECEAALRRGGRPLVFFNAPAGGGDGVCRAARANGERMELTADRLVPPAGLPAAFFPAAGGGECLAPPADVAWPLAVQSPYLQDVALGRAFGEEYRLTFLAPGGQVSGLGFHPQTPLVAFTLLRDPRARWAAEFRSQPPASLAARLVLDHAPSLQEYLELETADGAAHDNVYVRFFLGLRDAAVPLTQRHLERAKAVLNGLDAVLVAERLSESGCLLRNFGWTDAAEGLDNAPDDSAGAGGLLHRLTRWDQELYQHAVQLFEDQLARCECCRYYEPRGREAVLPTPDGSPGDKGG